MRTENDFTLHEFYKLITTAPICPRMRDFVAKEVAIVAAEMSSRA